MEKEANDVPFTALILGGGGLVGRQVALRLARLPHRRPKTLVICALTEAEVNRAKEFLLPQLPEDIEVAWEYGNLFVPTELSRVPRAQLESSAEFRSAVLKSIFDPLKQVWENNFLASLILKYEPAWIVDSVNTATGISYANAWDCTAKVLQDLTNGADLSPDSPGLQVLLTDVQMLMLSQGIPQLARHVEILQEATREVGTSMYVKVGTTGTGGMGFNIPYTHGEGGLSLLMGKNAISGGQALLMFLLARTPSKKSCLVVKGIFPAAMIGYSGIRFGKPFPYKGWEFDLYDPRLIDLADCSSLDVRAVGYSRLGDIKTTMVGTGENGEFALGEFETITAPGQMEMTTAEEVATVVVAELIGRNTGHDVIAALDGAVMPPSNHGGLIRERALATARKMAEDEGDFSVALGELGPPRLTKWLYEIRFILEACKAEGVDLPTSPDEAEILSLRLARFIETNEIGIKLAKICTSIGLPILFANGQVLRGPRINIPESIGHTEKFPVSPDQVEYWAKIGWVDIRPDNMRCWIERLLRINDQHAGIGNGSDEALRSFAQSGRPGEIVAQLFAEEGSARIK